VQKFKIGQNYNIEKTSINIKNRAYLLVCKHFDFSVRENKFKLV